MAPPLRKPIVAPNGKTYFGRWPQTMPNTGEGPYIAALARRVQGACEVVVPLGRADVASNDTIFEVEPVRSWRTGARQVLAYAAQTGQTPAVALFGDADYLRIYLWIRDRLPGVHLWVWRNVAWGRVASRREASYRGGYDYAPADPATPPVRRIDPVTGRALTLADRL